MGEAHVALCAGQGRRRLAPARTVTGYRYSLVEGTEGGVKMLARGRIRSQAPDLGTNDRVTQKIFGTATPL